MFDVPMNKALNTEIKYYGLSYLGLIGASIIGCSIWAKFGMASGIMAFIVGYGVSAVVAKSWHAGNVQRYIYWHLPASNLFGGKYLPNSHHRCLL